MAIVPITVTINGQTYNGTANIPTVMIPELNGFIPPWNENNLIAIWDASSEKTEKATVEQFRTYIIEGGGTGTSSPPVLQGNMYEITVTDANAPWDAAKGGRYRINVPELANQLYTLHRRGPATLKTSEWLNLASGGFDLRGESRPAEIGETFFAAVYNIGFSGPPVVEPPPPPACVPVAISGAVSFPDGQVGVAYNYSISVTGTAAFAVTNQVKPAGISITVQGNNINITGTPTTEGNNLTISFTINNACGSVPVSDTINIAAAVVDNPPPPATFVIIADVAGQSIFAYCQNASGQAAAAPFTTQITVNFSYTNQGSVSIIHDSRTVTLITGQSQIGVFTHVGVQIIDATVYAVVPTTNGTDTYSF